MIRKILLLFLAIVSLMSCSKKGIREPVKLSVSAHAELLDSAQAEVVFNQAKYFPNNTQIALCIITGEKEKYIGILRQNDSLIYIENRDRIFEIGSITKTFTGTILAKLAYTGETDLNKPVKDCLPFKLKQSSFNGKEITLLHLANHTSGLPFEPGDISTDKNFPFDAYNPYKYYSTERLYKYLSNNMAPQFTPGEKRVYSNLGAGLLGHILTLITGQTYEELLFATVCRPLGMKNTFVKITAENKKLMVQGRNPSGSPVGNTEMNALTGAGAIKSNVSDLARYIKANMSDTTYFYLAQKPTVQYNKNFSGALGWAPYSENGNVHQGAFGATGGFSSGLIFERNKHIGIIVLTNVSAFLSSRGNYIENLCRGLYDPLIKNSKK